MNFSFSRRHELPESLLAAPLRFSCAYGRCCRCNRDKFLRRCTNSAWKVSWVNGPIPPTNPANDQVPGSSYARTWSGSS
jgi:hypothetical protein